MVSAYVVSSESAEVPRVAADLESVGIAVLGRCELGTMVQDVIRTGPDLVVCYEAHPDDALFAGIDALNRSAPRPTVVFTTDPDAEKIERAARSGIHAYVVNGYGAGRLRSVLQVAQARFRYVEVLRQELADVHHRFSERKLIDQAKAILMRLRNLPEDNAYAALRTAAMKANRRMGQVARTIIEAARYGDAVNRAGHLRMTSQRLVKLYALQCMGVPPEATRGLFEATLKRIEENLAALGRSLSKPTFGDLLEEVAAPSAELRSALAAPPSLDRLARVDALAERVLIEAEQLTTTLETAGVPAALRLINVAGRQRMLSQRYAKQALLAALLKGPAADAARTALGESAAAYRAAMAYLDAVPLSTPAITALFAGADAAWTALEATAADVDRPAGRNALLIASETLLGAFEELTAQYERNLQVLMQS